MSENAGNTAIVDNLISELREGNEEARDELIRVASARLLRLTRKLRNSFHGSVGRWEQTDDVFQRATLRLCQSLEKVELNDSAHFFRLAATQIRRELIDLARHYKRMNAKHLTRHGESERSPSNAAGQDALFNPEQGTGNPHELQEWAEFHAMIEGLPEQLKNVVNLLWYHGMSQSEAAQVLETSERNVRRYWRAARLHLHEKLGGRLPGE